MFTSVLEADFNLITEILLEKQRATKTDLVQMVTYLKKEDIRPVCAFLLCIKKWSDLLEREVDETLHFVWPAFIDLQKILTAEDDENEGYGFALVELMKIEGRAYLLQSIDDFKPKINHKFAAVLHPLMRKLPNIDTSEREFVYEQMEAKVKELSKNDENVELAPIAPVVRKKKSPTTVLSAFFEADLIEASNENREHSPTELKRYLELQIKVNPETFDLKSWWFENRIEFPNLAKMFTRYLCTPATSAPSERNFSQSGLIISNRRSRLLPQNISNLIIARNIYKN